MEITWATRVNMAALLVGLVTILSEYVQVHGQRSRTFAEGALRLVGGRTKHEGTVLIYHWSRWGSICDDYWDIRDANVVCRELGYPGALEAPRRSRYGKGRRRVWLSGLHCRGNEEYVTMCVSRGWGQYLRRCSSYWSSAGVVCRPNPESGTNGTDQSRRHHRNRVRAMVPRPATMSTKPTPTTSTTTTTTTTTTTPSTTTTTTTTTPTPITTKIVATHESSDTRDTLAMLGLDLEAKELPGSESSLDLQSDASFLQQQGSNRDSAITGAPAPAPAQTSQPLPEEEVAASPDHIAKAEVVPGIAIKSTNRVPLATRPMSTTASTVPTTTTKRPTTPTPTKRPTITTTTKRPTTVTTTTEKPATTTKPVPREYNRWVYDRDTWRYYMYFRDGRVITSRPDPRYYRYTSTTKAPATTSTTTRRPTTRPTTRATAPPRSQMYNLQEISNSVGSGSDPNNAIDVIAPSEIRHRPSNTLQRHEGRHSHRHHSEGKAGYVGDQPVDVVTVNEIPGKPATKAPEPDAPNYTEYRVVGGREYENYKEGRIEIRLAGSNVWGVLCGDLWDLRGAIVACRHLGTGYARMAQTTDFYGGSDMLKVASAIRCTGREERLEDCILETYEKTPGKEMCSKPKSVAGVICETRLPDLEPDVSALQSSVYLQDRYAYYLQCAFEEGCLSSSATALKNTRRWDYATRRLLRFSTVAINNGKADFRPNIDRSRWEWHACHMHFHSMEAFSHYDLVDTNGNKVAEGHKASFCLEDSHCNRGVYPKYDCQHNGNQGISVGCRDSYLHDIDCQWIDVTDVKPGTYTLKVEINPQMLVPEISFDNNVAICTLYITRTTARAWGCKMGSLL